MSSRAAKFASLVFAASFTGATVIAILHGAADAAEGCQTEPGNQAPQGKHWYYRIERPGNRQCWYLRDMGERPAQAGVTQRSEKPDEAKTEAVPPQRSLADAHAEYPWPQTRVEQNTAASVPQPPQATPTDAVNAESGQRPNVLEGTTRGSLIGTRWPDPSSANSTLSPQPATSDTIADAQADQQPSTPAQAAPPAALAAADASPAKPPASLQTLLMVVAGALALAGLTGSAIFRFASARRPAPNTARGRRRVVWETADGARQSPPPRPAPLRQSTPRQSPPRQSPPWVDPDQFKRRPEVAPGFHAASDSDERLDRISQMLERMSKQASN